MALLLSKAGHSYFGSEFLTRYALRMQKRAMLCSSLKYSLTMMLIWREKYHN
jgi:hypothetical protein